jgi:hypothetical protein
MSEVASHHRARFCGASRRVCHTTPSVAGCSSQPCHQFSEILALKSHKQLGLLTPKLRQPRLVALGIVSLIPFEVPKCVSLTASGGTTAASSITVGATPAAGTTGGLFGQLGQTTAPTTTGGMFGNLSGQKPQPFTPLFGGTTSTTTPGTAQRRDADASLLGSTLFGSTNQPTSGLGTSTVTSTSSSSSVPAVPPPSMLRGKSIDDIINKWTVDLDTHVQAFERYAVEVATWDRALLQNANNVSKPLSPSDH